MVQIVCGEMQLRGNYIDFLTIEDLLDCQKIQVSPNHSNPSIEVQRLPHPPPASVIPSLYAGPFRAIYLSSFSGLWLPPLASCY